MLQDDLTPAEEAWADEVGQKLGKVIWNAALEECAKIAETVDVPCNGHPQIDAPTIGDAKRVIAAAIRAGRK